MKDSLQRLLEQFPDFFDKRGTSNFTLSQTVTNNEFKKIRQSVEDTINSFHLDKRILIWKEQSEKYDYSINFIVSFPHLKSVRIYKNNTIIYTRLYGYDENADYFSYTYTDSTLNDVEDETLADIIPQHKFHARISTYDEIDDVKGWPENETIKGTGYDHDISLDEIGALNNIPRKKYLKVNSDDYEFTEPLFNDRLSEDDYHYMQRMLEYNIRLHTTHPVLLEIWKIYGIEATMENRERLLIKLFDIFKHQYHYDREKKGDQLLVDDWVPEQWEHKDTWCDYSSKLGKYFFVKASTRIPVKNQDVILQFKLLNSLAQEIEEDYTVDILLNNNYIVQDCTTDSYILKSSDIPQSGANTFIVRCKDAEGVSLPDEELIITVRGCNDADFYVKTTGDNRNDGKSWDTAFKTVQKAINSIVGDNNLIAVQGGTYNITNYAPIIVRNSATILGCGGVILKNTEDNRFFQLPFGKSLLLQDLTLNYKGDLCNVTSSNFTNNNGDRSNADVILYSTDGDIHILTRLELTVTNTQQILVGDSITFTGTLYDEEDEPMSEKTILISDGSTEIELETDEHGEFTGSLTANTIGNLTLTASYSGDSIYTEATTRVSLTVKMSLEDLLSNYDYVVMDMVYEDQDWDYLNKSVSEITILSDLDSAVMTVTFSQDDVQFERFSSYSEETIIDETTLLSLNGLLVGIIYDDYTVKYKNLEVN